jgi:SAM-dependent methyltransferase
MELARSFALVAEEYERGRPGYPATAIEWVLGDAPLDVIDLGAGTGKLTAGLVATGHRVVAVEPLAEMRAILAQRLPEVQIVNARAEDTRLPPASADAVVAGAAFHWFDRTLALSEIARVLRPRATFGLLGNGLDTSVPWVARLQAVLGDQKLNRAGHWPDADELCAWFDATEEQRFPFGHQVDLPRLLDLAVSRSAIASLGPAAQRQVLDRITALWDNDPDLDGRDSVQLPFLTRALRATRGLTNETVPEPTVLR